MISCRAPSLMRGILIASVEEIIRVVIVQRIEFILSADATVQRFSVLPKLDVGQPSRNAAIAIGIEGIDVDGSPDVAARIDAQRIGDLHALAVDHAGLFLTGGVDKVELAVSMLVILRFHGFCGHVAQITTQLQFAQFMAKGALFRIGRGLILELLGE